MISQQKWRVKVISASVADQYALEIRWLPDLDPDYAAQGDEKLRCSDHAIRNLASWMLSEAYRQ
jgi:hypothetical protein